MRVKLRVLMFEGDTPRGKRLDIIITGLIGLSVLVVMLETVKGIDVAFGKQLRLIEWGFTGLFTLEYLLRLWSCKRIGKYSLSFYGIVDLLAILPTYMTILVPGSSHLIVLRSLRIVRILSLLKVTQEIEQVSRTNLLEAFNKIIPQIKFFVGLACLFVVVMGTLMHFLEGGKNGFDNIPLSIYWAIVTLTTVGYGDIVPVTPIGRAISAIVMLVGYSLILAGILTTILSSRMIRLEEQKRLAKETCPRCLKRLADIHPERVRYCKFCGFPLKSRESG